MMDHLSDMSGIHFQLNFSFTFRTRKKKTQYRTCSLSEAAYNICFRRLCCSISLHSISKIGFEIGEKGQEINLYTWYINWAQSKTTNWTRTTARLPLVITGAWPGRSDVMSRKHESPWRSQRWDLAGKNRTCSMCVCSPRNVLLPNFIGIVIVWYCAKHTGTVTSIIIAGACPPMIHSRRQYLSISDDLKFVDNENKCRDMGEPNLGNGALINLAQSLIAIAKL